MKFEIIDLNYGGIQLYSNNHMQLIYLGNLLLSKQNYPNNSFTVQSDKFNYHNQHRALRGSSGRDNHFGFRKLVVIQMV